MDERIEKTGLGFFGAVIASISHEIKNRIAIINEHAGLLEDLVLLAERSGQIDLDRLKKLSGSIKDQVIQGDRILRNMNRFAHSVDAPLLCVELRALLDLTVQLAARAANLKGVDLEVGTDCRDVELTTGPFLLMNLIWLCIDSIPAKSASGSVLRLEWEAEPGSVLIRICSEEREGSCGVPKFPGEADSLAKAIGAELVPDRGCGGWAIRLPAGVSSRKG